MRKQKGDQLLSVAELANLACLDLLHLTDDLLFSQSGGDEAEDERDRHQRDHMTNGPNRGLTR